MSLEYKLMAFSQRYQGSTVFPENREILESLRGGFPFTTVPRLDAKRFFPVKKTKTKRGYTSNPKQNRSVFLVQRDSLFLMVILLNCTVHPLHTIFVSFRHFNVVARFSRNGARARARAHRQK